MPPVSVVSPSTYSLPVLRQQYLLTNHPNRPALAFDFPNRHLFHPVPCRRVLVLFQSFLYLLRATLRHFLRSRASPLDHRAARSLGPLVYLLTLEHLCHLGLLDHRHPTPQLATHLAPQPLHHPPKARLPHPASDRHLANPLPNQPPSPPHRELRRLQQP